MPQWSEIPWLGVVVAVVASQIIGFLWYGPLFGKPWRAGMGITDADMQDRSGLGQLVVMGIIWSIVSAIAIAALLSMTGTPDLMAGVWVGFLASLVVTGYILITAGYEKRNMTVAWIGVANQMVTSIVVGAILAYMW